MAKLKKVFICSECGYKTSKWLGQCPECSSWNSFQEEVIQESKSKSSQRSKKLSTDFHSESYSLKDIKLEGETRIVTGIGEFDRIVGGGIFKDSLLLIGGEPGIGKSTLILQIANQIVRKGKKVLYVSGEESLYQIKERSKRLGIDSDDIFILNEIEMKKIESAISKINPDVLVIDSVQTIYFDELESMAGSVSQIREVTSRLMYIAKHFGITIFVIGHITKGGMIAGPMVLEHMVDTVLYFEGDRNNMHRLLRAIKNRFGATNEIGIFEMTGAGLTEVKDPSSVLLSGTDKQFPGVVLSSVFEGTRVLVVEIQSLVTPTTFGMPRRLSTGIDYNRFTLLIAIIEKKLRLPLHTSDIFVNLTGGIKIVEPSMDLAILLAITTAFKELNFRAPTIALGEVGLNGEVRPVPMIETRIKAAKRQGFQNFIVPHRSRKSLSGSEFSGLQIDYLKNVDEIFQIFK